MPALEVFTDGGSRGNPGPAAIAALVYGGGRLLKSHSEFIGEATNNVAEYRAVIRGLKLASAFGSGPIAVTLDSQLVASQLSGAYKVKKGHLQELWDMAKKEERRFSSVEYRHVMRTDPRVATADRLLNAMLDAVRRKQR